MERRIRHFCCQLFFLVLGRATSYQSNFSLHIPLVFTGFIVFNLLASRKSELRLGFLSFLS